MLKQTLQHPPLLGAVAAAGHGARILLADGNFPISTAVNQAAQVVYLNLRRGLLTVSDVLQPLTETIAVEAAALMQSPDGSPVAAHEDYRDILGPDVPFQLVERFAFYDATRAPDVAVAVATGDERLCANLLLTVGLP